MAGTVITEPSFGSECATCNHPQHSKGVCFAIEAAKNPEGVFEADLYLQDLHLAKIRSQKRRRLADLLIRFEQLASNGSLDIPLELRQLRGAIWEIKTAQDRLPFFYSDHDGASRGAVRLTHGFMKDKGKTAQGKTPRKQIDHAEWIYVKGAEQDGR
jgi:hypothetical protein